MSPSLDVAAHILDDPRGRTEGQWLDTLDFLVSRLADATSCELQIGRYWIDDGPSDRFVALGVRVRAKDPLPNVHSDYWEAAVCYTGSHKGAYADVFVFPFLNGSRVTQFGRIADRGAEVDECWWLNFADGEFQSKGWSSGEFGEWSRIKQPGDEYQQSVECSFGSTSFSSGNPITMAIRHPDIKAVWDKRKSLPYSPRVSLIHVNRNRENTNLVPWNQRPPRPNSRGVQTLDELRFVGDSLQIDLAKFSIRGGWIPGKYHVSIRLQNFHDAGDWTATSEISPPLKFRIQ